MSSVDKHLMYAFQKFVSSRSPLAVGSVVKKRVGSCIQSIRCDMILRIHLCCGSFGSIIRFWILVKKRNIRFRIKNPDLDFSKETYQVWQKNAGDEVGNKLSYSLSTAASI